MSEARVLHEGRWLTLCERDGWEFVRRRGARGVVLVVAVTPAGELLLVEQFRAPLGVRVLELPAGLAGDLEGCEDEDFAEAARRELEEETGWAAAGMTRLAEGPVSAGLTSEVVSFYRAEGLERVGPGGGDATEDIEVHAVPLGEVEAFLKTCAARGCSVDPKVFAALYFAGR